MQNKSEKNTAQIARKCLIIEDSEFDQRMMSRVIDNSKIKMECEVCSTLEEGWRALHKTNFALLLLDNNLPDGYGANFVLKMAADKRLGEIPVIMVSDWPSPFMRDKAEKAGVTYIVDKSEFGGRYIEAALRKKAASMPSSGFRS